MTQAVKDIPLSLVAKEKDLMLIDETIRSLLKLNGLDKTIKYQNEELPVVMLQRMWDDYTFYISRTVPINLFNDIIRLSNLEKFANYTVKSF